MKNRVVGVADRALPGEDVEPDTTLDPVVGLVQGFGTGLDLMITAPAGNWVFMTLHGPNHLTRSPARGVTPSSPIVPHAIAIHLVAHSRF